MPAHRSNDVTRVETGQILEEVQSYDEKWILRLIAFFVLSGVIVAVCVITLQPTENQLINGAQNQFGTELIENTTTSGDKDRMKNYVEETNIQPIETITETHIGRQVSTVGTVDTGRSKSDDASSTTIGPSRSTTETPDGRLSAPVENVNTDRTRSSDASSTTISPIKTMTKTPVGESIPSVTNGVTERNEIDDVSSTTINLTETTTEPPVGESISPVKTGKTYGTGSEDAFSTTISPTETMTDTPDGESIAPVTDGDTDRTEYSHASSTTIESSRSTTETPVGRSTSPVKTGNTYGTSSEDASLTSSSPTETTRETPVGESTSPVETENAYSTGNDDASPTTISPTETITETPDGEIIPPVTSGDTDRAKSDDASSTTINLTETITETPVGELISPVGTENIYRTGNDAATSTTINLTDTTTETSEERLITPMENGNTDRTVSIDVTSTTINPTGTTTETPVRKSISPITNGDTDRTDGDDAWSTTIEPVGRSTSPVKTGNTDGTGSEDTSSTSSSPTETTTETPVGESTSPMKTGNAYGTGNDDASQTTISPTETTTETPVGRSTSPVKTGNAYSTGNDDASPTMISPTETITEAPDGETIPPVSSGDTDRTDGDDASSTTTEPSRSTTETPVGRSTSPVKTGNTYGTGSEDASSTSISLTETTTETPVGESTSPVKTGNAYGTGNDDASPTTISPTETVTKTPVGESIPPVTNGDTDRSETDDASSSTTSPTETTTGTPVIQKTDETVTVSNKSNLEARSQSRTKRMISYMNDTADPCQDFYEYACGGFEANDSISEKNLVQEAIQKIFAWAEKTKESKSSAEFLNFYNSCVEYEKNFSKSDKMKLAIEAIHEVGRFNDTVNDDFDFTTMLYKLILRNSVPFFDITPDISHINQPNCKDPLEETSFTLKIGPSILGSMNYDDVTGRFCYANWNSESLTKNVDSYQLYKNKEKCKNSDDSFLELVEQVLKEHPAHTSNKISIKNDTNDMITKYFKQMKQTDEIRKAYLMKNYTPQKATMVRKGRSSLVDWPRLMKLVRNSEKDENKLLQIYFLKELNKGLKELSGIEKRKLRDALLGLYAHKVYDEFVVPRHDVENYCKNVTVNLMQIHASRLYMSSFPAAHRERINATVTGMFEKLRGTLELKVKNASGIKNSDDKNIIRKIRGLSIAIPDISYYQNGGELDPENSKNKLSFTGNFFRDAMMLLNNSKKSMYRLLEKSTNEYEQIWTYFAQPYQTSGSVIYQLNKIILPYGIVDWSTLWSDEKEKLSHLVMATLGTRIAKEIAHHFDPTGINFLGNMKSSKPPMVFCSDDEADKRYENYVAKNLSISAVNRTLFVPSIQKTVEYQISDLSLNERFSEITGLQLAYDTMLLLPSDSKQLLPWSSNLITDEKKQFFLAYAQMYCTKQPSTSSYTSLYEDGRLPSRLQILVVGSNNKFLGDTWKCPKGSNVRPHNIPSTFPNMDAVIRTAKAPRPS